MKLLEKTLRTMKEVQEARKQIKNNEREAGLRETKEIKICKKKTRLIIRKIKRKIKYT